ncbi:MAG: HupE/UreJ family protein [Deltaproteobacteria bacterium]|nr:MAG: HupE/UreJ family protein [Deltaproteobacteria bacterium]
MRRAALAIALALAAVAPAAAHTRSVSYSSWQLDSSGATVQARISLLELSRLAFDPALDVGTDGAAAQYLAAHLALRAGDAPCAAVSPIAAVPAPKGWAHFRWRIACNASGPRSLESSVLLDAAPSHLHFARVAGGPAGVRERVLTEAEPAWTLEAAGGSGPAAARGTTLFGYIALGVVHIATGWDHLAFLLALLLLARRLREVAVLVTAFTAAHSVTLALAVLGVVRPNGAAIEALIGYSIALVAAENAWLLGGRGAAVPVVAALGTALLAGPAVLGVGSIGPLVLAGLALFTGCHFALLARAERPARLRAAVAFVFGLVHGFGFAGVLAEMELPTARLAPALFGFNVGVELGQLAAVALVWPVLRAIARASPHRFAPRVAELGSAAVCGLGLFWFVTRAFS